MTVKYKTVITRAGAEKLAAATLPNGKKVNFAAMAVGDGGGKLPEPNASQTKLVNEVWRHALNKISQDKKHKNYVVAELVIPPETGGFWLREMGLYDDTGALIAVGNMAESYKPELAEGSGRAQTLRMVIMVSDIDTVELSIDTTLVMATQDYVDDKLAEHEQSRRHPDATLKEKGFTQLSSATDSTSEVLAATPNAVKAAYDLAKGKYTAQDATTAQKGIVQLSSATDSVSEALAATPKAVKAAHDLASGKYTAQDATTKQKGIVQLTSVTDSESETLAATPKAVKAANDNANGRVPSGRKVNGRALTADISVTAQDIFNGQTVGIGNALDLNSFTTPGLYYQPANAQAQTGKNYPEIAAGSLEVYKHAGITQIYRIYNNSRCYIRTLYSGVWTGWARSYDSLNKPTFEDVGAIGQDACSIAGFNSGNAAKPYMRHRASNAVVQLATETWVSAGFQPKGSYTPAGQAYTKAESDGRFQPKGSYTPAGQAYTKAESDARFQGKSQISLATNGWRKTQDGLLVQWGTTPALSAGQVYTVPLPAAVPNAILSAVASVKYQGIAKEGNMGTYVNFSGKSLILSADYTKTSIQAPRTWMIVCH